MESVLGKTLSGTSAKTENWSVTKPKGGIGGLEERDISEFFFWRRARCTSTHSMYTFRASGIPVEPGYSKNAFEQVAGSGVRMFELNQFMNTVLLL